ncbi:MAG: RNA pseudouridine synthase [Planctomycetes bacterium]|nr:RNA pseudouridine synthase [Planctomycetota bacterium]
MTEGGPPSLEILYERGPCLVVAKPPGVLTQAPPGIDSIEARVRRFLQIREGKQHHLYLGMPHRLDRPVSGALVIARHVRAAQRIAEQFEQRRVEKRYWALVEGELPPSDCRGTWSDFMRKLPDEARSEIVAADHPEARQAILHWESRATDGSISWLEIQLETGRTHQIRLQAMHHGHAVLGDELYGARSRFGPPAADPRQRWIALHARRLSFDDPMTRERVAIEAPLSSAWSDYVKSEE